MFYRITSTNHIMSFITSVEMVWINNCPSIVMHLVLSCNINIMEMNDIFQYHAGCYKHDYLMCGKFLVITSKQ